MLRPFIRRVIGTATILDMEQLGLLATLVTEDAMRHSPCMPADCRRAWMCIDWLIRTYAATWLRLAGEDTALLDALPEVTSARRDDCRHGRGGRGYVQYGEILIEALRSETATLWTDCQDIIVQAGAVAGADAALEAVRRVPELAPDAPEGQVTGAAALATSVARSAMMTVVIRAVGAEEWKQLQADRRATLPVARHAAWQAAQQVLRTAPAPSVRAAKRAARRATGPDARRLQKGRDDVARRDAEDVTRLALRRLPGPYVWIRAKGAGLAVVLHSRKALSRYGPEELRSAVKEAAVRAYREVWDNAPWQPAMAVAQETARQALAPTTAELQDSAAALLGRLAAR
ncbi:hypothetical protein ABZ721_30695 [Streptomyces sp. NPDC006733]|uniref:hypothetical protein n=1 Tax=Streptomyces sp. NPDC006733 TaxID=3155460 RepID=UPI0033E5C792